MRSILTLLLSIFHFSAMAQLSELKSTLSTELEERKTLLFAISDSIWHWSEPTFKEYSTVDQLKTILRDNQFDIQDSIAGLPTMFIASYGSDGPQIDILSEADADGIVSEDDRFDFPVTKHSAGHHLLAVGSLGAALAIQRLIRDKKVNAKIRLVHSTAEGSLGGRVFMVREGVFEQTDLAFFWHPAPVTTASLSKWDAIIDIFITFRNDDTMEALEKSIAFIQWLDNLKVQFPENLVIEKKISNESFDIARKGDSVNLKVRLEHTSQSVVNAIHKRIVAYLNGKARTKVYRSVAEFVPSINGNSLVSSIMNGMDWHRPSKRDSLLAERIFIHAQKKIGPFLPDPLPFREERDMSVLKGYGSDIGDVSWHAPLISFVVSWLPSGLSMSNWEGGAFGSSEYAKEAMMKAAMLISYASLAYLTDPKLQYKIKQEHAQKTSEWRYEHLMENHPDTRLNGKRSY